MHNLCLILNSLTITDTGISGKTCAYLVYGVLLQISLYTFETVAKLVLGTGPVVDHAGFFPLGAVEAVFFGLVGADAGPLLEAGTDPDDLDMARCIHVFLEESKAQR